MRTNSLNDIERIIAQSPPDGISRRMLCFMAAPVAATAALGAVLLLRPAPAISGDQVIALAAMVRHVSETQRISEAQAWQRLHDRFDVTSTYDLTTQDFGEAVRFLAQLTGGRRHLRRAES